MKNSEYETLINKGFRIYKINKDKIWIRNKKGWSIVDNYSETRWSELLNNDKALCDQ